MGRTETYLPFIWMVWMCGLEAGSGISCVGNINEYLQGSHVCMPSGWPSNP